MVGYLWHHLRACQDLNKKSYTVVASQGNVPGCTKGMCPTEVFDIDASKATLLSILSDSAAPTSRLSRIQCISRPAALHFVFSQFPNSAAENQSSTMPDSPEMMQVAYPTIYPMQLPSHPSSYTYGFESYQQSDR